MRAFRPSEVPVVASRRWRRARARRSGRGGQAAILLYHRIASPARDPWGLSVSVEAFEQQLELLASEYHPMALAELVRAADKGRIPPRAVALTFDDGYVDNLDEGLPLLERHGVPATIYVATGYVDRGVPYWWDELDFLVAGEGRRPEELEVGIDGRRIRLATATAEEREQVLGAHLHPALRRSPVAEIERVLDDLRQWAGEDAARHLGRAATGDELTRLAASDLIEIGAHTRSHASLPALAPEIQREEIAGSGDWLEEHLGRHPRSFSYPFGDNRRHARRLTREAGYDHAVGTDEHTPLTSAAPRFSLPRTAVNDRDDFEALLSELLG